MLFCFKAATHSLLFLETNVRSAYRPAGSQIGGCSLFSVTETNLGSLYIFRVLLSSQRGNTKALHSVAVSCSQSEGRGSLAVRGSCLCPLPWGSLLELHKAPCEWLGKKSFRNNFKHYFPSFILYRKLMLPQIPFLALKTKADLLCDFASWPLKPLLKSQISCILWPGLRYFPWFVLPLGYI